MSGFAGIANANDEPVDRELLERLTRSIAFRGPDAREIRIQGSTGFGHTMLRTTREAERERQPCTLDGEVWIAADCRIDGREALLRDLAARGRSGAKDATDPELILHAYAAWDLACLDYLIGDFAFAIHDGRKRRLFCARDQLGVKPFYYARTPSGGLVFGNTLNSLRLHPGVSNRLNDLAVADHLLFGFNQEPGTTIFADIRRLPDAHFLVWSGADVRVERYWSLPVDPPLRLRHGREYVDRFLDLFRAAIRDRLRTSRAGILMSGGLDSTGMAAIACELSRREQPVTLSAHTAIFDRLIPDRERYYAGIAAEHLGIPIHFHVADDYRFFESSLQGETTCPEPGFITDFGASPANAEMAGIAAESRVALYGEGPDNALYYEWKPYLKHEFRQGHFIQVIKDIASLPLLFGELPFWKRRSRAKRPHNPSRDMDPLPPWLDADFVSNLHLAERCAHFCGGALPPDRHPFRPRGFQTFSIALWQSLFEWHDPGASGLLLEVRNPYLDLRLLRFLLSLPVIPWCRNKYLLRRAFGEYLPPEIISRPKTGLAGFPNFERWKEIGLPPGLPTGALGPYIDVDRMEKMPIDSHGLLEMRLRSSSLAIFLRGLSPRVHNKCT